MTPITPNFEVFFSIERIHLGYLDNQIIHDLIITPQKLKAFV